MWQCRDAFLMLVVILLGGLFSGVQAAGDTCATARVVTANGTYAFDTTGASDDDPCSIIPTVWYRFTAPSSGTVFADLCGSTYDTYLTAFSGASCPGSCTGIVAQNNNSCNLQSAITFPAVAGQTYQFSVSGWGPSDFGPGVFNFRFQPSPGGAPIAGDTCEVAGVFTGNGSSAFDLTSASAGDDPCDGPGWRTLWYRYTAPANGRVTADTCGSSFPTNLQGFIASGCPVTCADRVATSQFDCDLQSVVSFDLAEGDTAYFVIGGVGGGDAGPGVFNLLFEPLFGGDSCETAEVIVDSGAYLFDTTGSVGGHPCDPLLPIVWFQFTLPVDGTLRVDLSGCTFDAQLVVVTHAICPITCATFSFYTPVPCDAPPAIQYRFPAGSSFLFGVTGSEPADFGSGVLNLTFTPVRASDTCFLIDLSAIYTDGSYPFDTTGASSNDPCVPSVFDVPTVWFSFIALSPGRLFADLCGSSFNTFLTLFPRYVCPAACESAVRSDNNGCGPGTMQSAVFWDVPAEGWSGNEGINLAISGWDEGDFGPGVLNIRFVPYILGDINHDGVVNVADVTELGRILQFGGPPIPVEVGDINGDGLVDETDLELLAAMIVND